MIPSDYLNYKLICICLVFFSMITLYVESRAVLGHYIKTNPNQVLRVIASVPSLGMLPLVQLVNLSGE